jgi:HPt (histidine-containing phosphotransfer) domain-containing protein
MPSLKDKLDALNKKYAANAGSRVAEIEACLNAYIAGSSDTDLEALYRKAHALAGTAKTFGLPEMSVTAKKLELEARTVENAHGVEKLLPLMDELKKLIPS